MPETGSTSQVVRVTLPSRGIPYTGKVPGGEIDVTAMTVKEWKLFTGAGVQGEERFNLLLSRCVRLPQGLSPLDLLTGDRMFLFVEIRKVSLPGSPYGFRVVCDNCAKEFRHEIKFEDVPVQMLDETWTEPFECKLPRRGDTLGLRVARGSDEKAVSDRTGRIAERANEPGDPAFLFRLSRHIVQVNGKTLSPNDAEQYVGGENAMPLADMLAIQQAVEKNDCGLRLMISSSCVHCGATNEFAMPVSKEFFRPRS